MTEDLHKLDQLSSRDLLDAGQARPAKLAVIGFPVAHSLSPRMHQPALDEAGIDCRYIKLEVDPGCVSMAFDRMRALGFIGCNVTVPHKFEALAACDEIDPGAAEMGAVNTVRFDSDATRGFNTDGYGFEEAVKETLGLSLAGASVLIAGAGGGAGGAIAVHCARQGVARLILANRSLDKIEELASRIHREHGSVEIEARSLLDPGLTKLAVGADLLVNTSSLGLKETDPSPLPVECFAPHHAVYDTIYKPGTAFQKAAMAAGARVGIGKAMLLHQGAMAFRIWFPGSDPVAAMRRGLEGT
ncbi:shikimate dehydrogenase [Luteolibacter luteus]|uniref:Shikimate dehydrogenase (NADP(+)) n=1 Tax=Luteolibacter luteus TaxID=2728835 RepID=A0A858RHZ5_9BACT|nr:shikimate dehydrogenase [Luteolibacter luteus]QJE96128.1 shikimate dehydrogenase [Luteolibacter luteus]